MSQPFFEYFSTSKVISLKRRIDRRTEFIGELKRIGQAFDGNLISWFDAISPADAGGFPSKGAKGCFLSHLEVLRLAQRQGTDRLLILEDDAHFVRDFFKLQEVLISNLKNIDWDIFYAGYNATHELPQTGPIASIAAETPLLTSHAVAMNKRAIHAAVPFLEAILSREAGSPEGGPMHVDGAYNWLRSAHKELKTVIAIPPLITQRSSVSDITPSTGLRSAVATKLRLRKIVNIFK